MAEATTTTTQTFQFELVSPEKILVSEQAKMVVVPGEAGDFGVLAQHSPLLSSIRPGVVTLFAPDGSTRRIFVAGGFADVNPTLCSVLAEEAVNVDELDRTKLEADLKNLEEDLDGSKTDPLKVASLQAQIDVTRAKIQATA